MNQIPTNSSPRDRLRTWFVNFCGKQWPRYFFLAFIGFIVHLPALQGGLIWDDAYLARDNAFIKSPLLALENFRHYLFADSFSGHYRPAQNLSFMLDYYFWNTDACGYHLTNILLHLVSGLLLYRLLTKLFRSGAGIWENNAGRVVYLESAGAFLVAALWIVHPVHSAAVDYISGRADSLAFLFCCAAWLLVLRGRETKTPALKFSCFGLAAFCALLGLCSREIACIWIFIFLVHTLVFTKGLTRRSKVANVLLCLLVVVAYVGLRSLPGTRGGNPPTENWGLPVRGTLMLRALGDYARLMVFPSNLHMERSVFDPSHYRSLQAWRQSSGAEYLSVLGLLVASALVYGCLARGGGQRLRILGAAWFFAAYIPVSNIVLLNATVAEHWLYLPSVGFLVFLLGCVMELPRNFQHAVAGIAALAVIAFGVRSVVRSSDWTDETTFYARTLAAGGSSARVAVNLGLAYGRQGDYAKAEKTFRRVLQLTPDYPIARNNLGDVLLRQGKSAEAEKLFATLAKEAPAASRGYPRTWVGILNYAHMRHHAKDDTGAIALLEGGRADYPEAWELVSLEAELVRQTQGPVAALQMVEQFTGKNWWHHGAALAAGRLYAENDDVPQATEALQRAARLDVHDTEALNLLARIYLRQNRLEQAFAAQRRAVARQPYQPRQYLMLAEILDKMGRSAEARNALDKVARLQAMATPPRVAAK